VIDVTRRSIEETAAAIMRLLGEREEQAEGVVAGLKPI
jgi:regulator of PEP synthase PpsR (kinase-PPPase family)